MEASVAGQGQGDGQGQGEAAEAAPQGPDIGALAEQLSSLSAGQEQMREFLQTQPWQAQEEGKQEGEGEPELDLSFLDPGDPDWNPEQIAQRLSGLIDQTAQQRVEAGLAPLQERVNEMAQERDWQAIADEFPELLDDEVNKPVFALAKQLAEHHGHPQLAGEPWFVRMAYITGKAMEAANEEGAESPSAAHLEGGGGAAPAGSSQVDLADLIVNGGEGAPLGRRALPF